MWTLHLCGIGQLSYIWKGHALAVSASLSAHCDELFCAGALHPSIPAGVQQRMIQFLERLHVAANIQRTFGSIGGPWEFNLRDLLRWCHLLESHVPANASPSAR